MDLAPSKPRRTSISSVTSRASTRSWRVPLAKQPPRTQLSAVFAESEAPVSRSPANQSALSILEARYTASNSNGPSSSSPTSMPDNRRGRQATQRQLSISGDSTITSESISENIDSPSEQVVVNGGAAVSPESAMPMDWQATPVEENGRKRTQSSMMTGGWFGSSGRSKSQKLQNQVVPGATLSREDTVVPAQNEATIQGPIPTASSWFSRSRTSTPLSSSPAPGPPALPTIVVASSDTTVPVAAPANITIPPIPPSLPIAVTEETVVSASPSRSSWFGSTRRQPAVVLPTTQSASSSSHGTPASGISDLPMDPVSEQDEPINEEMIATVTPATFAASKPQTQSATHSRSSSQQLVFQPNNARGAVPTSWFQIGGKRGSMTPSVDTHVPSLPPSPRRGHSPAPSPLLPTLMPIDRVLPLASPSLSTLGSSSARYALVSVLGRNRERIETAMAAAAEENADRMEAIEDWVLIVRSAQESRALITRAQAISMNQPRYAQSFARREIIEEMVLEQNDSVPNGSSAAPSIIAPSVTSPSNMWWPFAWNQANLPSETAIPDAQQGTQSAPPSTAPSFQEPPTGSTLGARNEAPTVDPVPESASWFGFWPWGQDDPVSGTQYPKTEAELIKEQAMARDQNRAGTGLSSPPLSGETLKPSPSDATPRPRDRNPIADDLYDNRSSWTSFFSLRSAYGAKKITLDGEGEVEVMDFSEDPDMPPGPVAIPPPVATLKGKTPVSKVVSEASTAATKGRSSSAGPARKDVDTTATTARSSSATPSKRSAAPKAPNMVLPTFEETFYTLPRALPPYTRPTSLKKMGKLVSGVLGINATGDTRRSKMREWQRENGVQVPRDHESLRASRDVGRDFPRVGDVLGMNDVGGLRDCKRVAILGVHGWFPGTIMRTLFGEPTGTSPKFASMMEEAVKEFMDAHGITLEKITMMPLEGEGMIEKRVEKLYQDFLAKKEWVEDLHEADVIFVATHSQGSVVSAHLLDKLIQDGHIRTSRNWEVVRAVLDTAIGGIGIHIPPVRPPQRVCCLALCGIHLGPLLYLGTSSIVNPYLTYFESAAAKELFEFQDTETEVSKKYIASLESVLEHGVKFVYVASLDDQVVPIYSGIFTAVNHPRILRALYIDGDAYSSSDFLSNLLVLLLKMRNAGLDDGGLLTHLSEATAGSLSGIGHSTAYLDPGAYKLAVRFLFETSDALGDDPKFEFEPFTAKASRNDYEIPWALRGLMTDPQCQELFGKELNDLRNAFDSWQPKTSAMKEVRKKLEPIRGKRSRFAQDPFSPVSTSSPLSPSSIVKSDKR